MGRETSAETISHAKMVNMKYSGELERAKKLYSENRNWLKKIGRRKRGTLDSIFQQEHDRVFEEIDCLDCANCCKTTSPIFIMTDIVRISKNLKMKAQSFITSYLRTDEIGDYVLKSAPCPFLMPDNKCQIYEFRPRACKEYPHTNRKRMYQILDLTLKNSVICPAVDRIIAGLKVRHP